MTTEKIHVHSDSCAPDSGFLFSLGAYGWTKVAILGNSLSAEDAIELVFEWCDDNAPGLLSTVGPEDYAEAARELGIAWEPEEAADADTWRAVEKAEADMLICGHATLKNGNALPSWEVHFDELDSDQVAKFAAELDGEGGDS